MQCSQLVRNTRRSCRDPSCQPEFATPDEQSKSTEACPTVSRITDVINMHGVLIKQMFDKANFGQPT